MKVQGTICKGTFMPVYDSGTVCTYLRHGDRGRMNGRWPLTFFFVVSALTPSTNAFLLAVGHRLPAASASLVFLRRSVRGGGCERADSIRDPTGARMASTGGDAPGDTASKNGADDRMKTLVMYLVVRKDLGWPLGPLIAQGAHAATAVLWEVRPRPCLSVVLDRRSLRRDRCALSRRTQKE